MEKIERVETILKACCAEEDTIYKMAKPFRVGDYVYATDGRIIVRTREPVTCELYDGDRTPNVNALHWASLEAKTVELPTFEIPPIRQGRPMQSL